MTELEINNRFDEINSKLDLVLQYVDHQRLKTEELEDLVKDVQIVGYDIFNTAVDEFEHNNIELNPEEIKMLVFRLMKNVGNLNQLMEIFESMNDLVKDLGPIVTDFGLSAIETIADFEKKGYFEMFSNLADNMDSILKVAVNFSKPEVIKTLETISKVATEVKLDPKMDNKSLFGLFKELKTPEVRQTLGYTLRMVKELNLELNKQ